MKNSVGTSEFMFLMVYVALLVLNGITLDLSGIGFVFDMNIPDQHLEKLFGLVVGWAAIRQVSKKDDKPSTP